MMGQGEAGKFRGKLAVFKDRTHQLDYSEVNPSDDSWDEGFYCGDEREQESREP